MFAFDGKYLMEKKRTRIDAAEGVYIVRISEMRSQTRNT
jgi:hypothetical protein